MIVVSFGGVVDTGAALEGVADAGTVLDEVADADAPLAEFELDELPQALSNTMTVATTAIIRAFGRWTCIRGLP